MAREAPLKNSGALKGHRPELILDEPFDGAWEEPPWPLATEVSSILPRHSWSLVVGLMFRAHAHLAGVGVIRATSDVDALLHLETRAITFPEASAALYASGFELADSGRFAYRFMRGDDKVDVMVADRHAARHAPTFRRSPLFPVPAGTRALSQTSNVIMQREGVEIASFSLPSLQGALALKGAAFLVDQRDHMRHVEDGIVLLSCIQEVSEIREGLAKRSRKRIRSLLKETSENRRVWRTLPSDVQLRAREVLGDMSRAFDVTGTDNSWTQAAQQDLSLRSPKLPVSGQSRRGDRGLGNTAGGGNKGSFAPHLRTEADGSALGSSPHRD